jgi:hypothetical protein
MKRDDFRSRVVDTPTPLVLPEGDTWEALEEFTLTEIGKGRGDEDQLLPKLCERTGWDWGQSQIYLREVQRKDQFKIGVIQTRLYLLVGIILGLVGAGFMMLALEFQRGSGDYSQCLSLEYTHAWKQIAGEQAFTPCLHWNSTLVVDPAFLALVGILMIAGSLLGALHVIRNIG